MVRIELTKEQTTAKGNDQSVESTVREIRRKTCKKYTAVEKLRTPALACGASVVLEGLRGEEAIALVLRSHIHFDGATGGSER